MVLDTNILIAYLNGDERVIQQLIAWRDSDTPLYISPIVRAEILSYPAVSQTDIARIRAFLQQFSSLTLDDDLVESAALIRRAYRLALPDALIAASALTQGVPLITRDKQFSKIKELKVIKL